MADRARAKGRGRRGERASGHTPSRPFSHSPTRPLARSPILPLPHRHSGTCLSTPHASSHDRREARESS